jgi:hypothetical protein
MVSANGPVLARLDHPDRPIYKDSGLSRAAEGTFSLKLVRCLGLSARDRGDRTG